MSILRKAHVAMSNLRKGCVALSSLGVHAHIELTKGLTELIVAPSGFVIYLSVPR